MAIRVRRASVRLGSIAIAAVGGLVLTGVAQASPASAAASGGSVVTLSYTDIGEHAWNVPTGVTSLHVVAIGGRGGSGYAPGGLGARAEGNVSVLPGNTLFIEVGGDGAAGTTAFNTRALGGANGGGSGGAYDNPWYARSIGVAPLSGAGGGGVSDLQTCPVNDCPRFKSPDSIMLFAAAGGGGAGADSAGGAGGTPNGKDAAITRDQYGVGTGATQSLFGRTTPYGVNVDPVWAVVGWWGDSYGGGGGGGGYYGGGAGSGGSAPPYELASGGGGGSSFGPASTVYSNTSEHASVTISYSTSFTVRLTSGANPALLLDIAGSSPYWGASLIQQPATGSASQVWTFVPVNGFYQIINKNSGMCLSTDGVAGHTLYQWPCMPVDSELWTVPINFGAKTSSPIRNLASGLYMEVYGGSTAAGGVIDAWPWNGGYSNQFFTPTPS